MEQKGKKKKKKAKGRKYNFKLIHDLFLPSLWLQGILTPLQDGLAVPRTRTLATGAANSLTLPLLVASRPHVAATWPGIWWISAAGQDITGSLGHAGGCTWFTERLASFSAQTKFSGAKRNRKCLKSVSFPLLLGLSFFPMPSL